MVDSHHQRRRQQEHLQFDGPAIGLVKRKALAAACKQIQVNLRAVEL